MEATIAGAAARDQVDMGLVSVDSATSRAHHHAAGMVPDPERLAAPDAAAGGKAYSSQKNRRYPRLRGIKAVIPEKADEVATRRKRGGTGGRPVSHATEPYKDRNTVERRIDRLRTWRGIATRYDKTPQSYEAGLHLRGAMLWIRSITPHS